MSDREASLKHIQFMEENGFVFHKTYRGFGFFKLSQIKGNPLRIYIEKGYSLSNEIVLLQSSKYSEIRICLFNLDNIDCVVNNFLDFIVCNFDPISSKINLELGYGNKETMEFYILTKQDQDGDTTMEFLMLIQNKQRECILVSKETIKKYMNVEYIILMQRLYKDYEIKSLKKLSERISGKILRTIGRINKRNKEQMK